MTEEKIMSYHKKHLENASHLEVYLLKCLNIKSSAAVK